MIYPLIIVADRYGGVYSKGKYTAWNQYLDKVSTDIDADDLTCGEFWNDNKIIVGLGETPLDAYWDLYKKLEKRRCNLGLYEETLLEIEEKKKRRESGGFNGIPFIFPRYREYFDSFEKGNYLGILANSGIGKSRFMRYWIYHIIDFALQNDYKTKVLYFALEDSRTQVNKHIIAHYLYVRHNISVSQRYLNSVDVPLSDQHLALIKDDEKFWKMLESIVWVITDCATPNEIHTRCEKVYEKYPEYHTFVFVDNYANLLPDDSDKSEWQAVRRFSRNIVRLRLCKTLGMTVIAILQADIETEKNTFRNVGAKGLVNLEPNSSSLGDNKVIIRDFFTLFGLFSPHKYEIKEYPYSGCYNVEVMRNQLLSLLMLKNNNGELAPRLGMRFSGKFELFEELPHHDDKEALDKIYRQIIEEEKEKFAKIAKYGAQKSMF